MACKFFISLETGPPSSLMDLGEIGLNSDIIQKETLEKVSQSASIPQEEEKKNSN